MPSRARRRVVAAWTLATAVACAAGVIAGASACGKSYGAADPAPELAEVGADADGALLEATTGDGPVPGCDPTTIATDPDHCGRCGHSCLGGLCVAGACQPEVLATFTASDAFGPVVDVSRAVVATAADGANPGRLRWCAKEGCAGAMMGVDLASTTPTSRRSLATDGTNVFVGTTSGTGAGIFRFSQSQVLQPITPIDGTFKNADNLAVLGSDVFFINSYQAGEIGIYRVPSAGTQTTNLIVPVQVMDRWGGLVALPNRVYTFDFETIATCAGASCLALEVFASPSVTYPDILDVATDGSTLFWATDAGLLVSCAVGSTCSLPTIVLGATSLEHSIPSALAIHGADLYVTTSAGKLFTCVAATCAQTLRRMATDTHFAGRIAVDENAVYWLGSDANAEAGATQNFRLMRVAK